MYEFFYEILRKVQILVRYTLSLFTHFSVFIFAAIFLPVIPHQLALLDDADIIGLDSPVGLQQVEAAIISRQLTHEVGKVVGPTQQL
jgi:hypothetical protein